MKYKYEIIEGDIKRMIEDGTLSPGDRIYSEDEIKKKYNVSSTTAVKALQNLVAEGYLIRKQGEGTFVRKSYKHKKVYVDEELPMHRKLKASTIGGKIEETKKWVFVKEIVDAQIAEQLKIEPNDPIIHFCRVGLVGGTPWTFQNSYIAKKRLPAIEETKIKASSSLSDFLKAATNINLFGLPMKARVSIAFPINEVVAEQLEIDQNVPVFLNERVSYHPDNTPFEYSKTYIHPDYYALQIMSDVPLHDIE